MNAKERTRFDVYWAEEDEEYVTEWDGQEFRATNPFSLDSKLMSAGAPQPRDLYMMTPKGDNND